MGIEASELKLFTTNLIQIIHTDNATRARIRFTVQNIRARLSRSAEKISELLADIDRCDAQVPEELKSRAEAHLRKHEEFVELLDKINDALENIPFHEEAKEIREFMHRYELILNELESAAKEAMTEEKREIREKEQESIEQARVAKIEQLKAIMKQKQLEEMKRRAMGMK